MADIIDFRQAAASMGRLGMIQAPALPPLESFDTLACMYCETDTPPSEVREDLSVVYRCRCRKVFHVVEDGTVCRGARGRPF